MFRLLGIGDQLVDRLAREDLVRQGDAPRSAGISAFEFKQKEPGKSKSKAAKSPTSFLRREYFQEMVLDQMKQMRTRLVSGDAMSLAGIHHQLELLA